MTGISKTSVTNYVITEHEDGQRVDNFLFRHYKGVPKSRIYRGIRGGEVRVNSKRIKAKQKLSSGDTLRLPPFRTADVSETRVPDQVLQLLGRAVLFENDDLLVINKPSGMSVHKGSNVYYGVIEGMRQLYGESLELAHRIDRGTSGCLLIAKNRSMLLALNQGLADKTIEKCYSTLVAGQWPANLTLVDKPLRKNTLSSNERIVKIDAQGKAAQTRFEIITQYSTASYLSAYPITGRTHQIRVHAASEDHPVAGDDKYGAADFNKQLRTLGLKRLFLHAASVRIPHEILGADQTFHAPLPDELAAVLEALSA